MPEAIKPREQIKIYTCLGYLIGQCVDRETAGKACAALDRLMEHMQALEDLLDQGDQDDLFGTEGWRHRLGID